MRKIIVFSFWMLFTAMSLMFFTQCKDDNNNPQPEAMLVVDDTYGYSNINLNSCTNNLNNLPIETLSQAEEDGILFMREEEKMARDFYQSMDILWNKQVFSNIASSEESHFAAMLLLIERYGLSDPAEGKAVGEFTNPTLQALYESLITQGNLSFVEALNTAAAVEEIDIVDLQNQLANIVDNQDLTLIYNNLLAASKNHLRAAVKNLDTQGVTYVPQYLTQAAFDEIINSGWDKGQRGG